jgi:hypothetical protein
MGGIAGGCSDGSSPELVSSGFSLDAPDAGRPDLERRRSAVRQYFQNRVADLDIVATTQTDSGTIIDWVPIKPSRNRPKPPPMPKLPELHEGESWARGELADQPWARGPEGTSPIVRFDVEEYLREVGDNVPDNPVDALKFPAPAPSSKGYYYNRYRLTQPTCSGQGGAACGNWGGYSQIELWDVSVAAGDHSIAQIAIARGSGTYFQTVETGKIETSSGGPKFFTYFTIDNYAEGGSEWTGGYNDGAAFQLWDDPTPNIVPGMAFASTSTETNRVILYVAVVHGDPGNAWWIWANGQWIGYYIECRRVTLPTGETGCSTPGAISTFSTGGLRYQGQSMSVYGEVYDSNPPIGNPPVINATSTDMGRGTAQGAVIKSMGINLLGSQSPVGWTTTTGTTSPYGTITSAESDAACYDMGPLFYSSTRETHFFYGGTGRTQSTAGPTCP